MKLIEDWPRKNLRCAFCGTDKSVKYTVPNLKAPPGDNRTEVCVCNRCAALYI